MSTTVMDTTGPSSQDIGQRFEGTLSSYPPIDRYGRKPERFFCKNCIIYIDNPAVAENHSVVTGHMVDPLFLHMSS